MNKIVSVAAYLILTIFITHSTLASEKSDPFQPTFTKLASGVWAAIRPDNPRFPVMGTSTFIVSDEGVIVFDGGGIPLYAERVIAKIKQLTDKPVTHVIVSHWHGDHLFGIYRYVEEFPGVEVISHHFTHTVTESERIRYIEKYPTSIPKLVTDIKGLLEKKVDFDKTPLTDVKKAYYQRLLRDAPIIDKEYKRAKITKPTMTFNKELTIHSGNRIVELKYLGDGNTEGDISMWLPKEKIVATGDTVVHPIPYAFNVPPRKWSNTLRAINNLDYNILVPGHGDIQFDSDYVELLITSSDTIANQRDTLLAKGLSTEQAMEMLDFTKFEHAFTHGDPYIAQFFKDWFEKPFRKSAFKALEGIPMVEIKPIKK